MSEHDDRTGPHRSADLVGLLRGELDHAETAMTAEHLRACPDCASDLIEVSLGHALLASAHLTLTRPAAVTVAAPTRPAPAPASPRWRRPGRLIVVAAAATAVALGGWAWWSGGDPAEPEPPAATAELEPLPEGGDGSGQVTMALDDSAATEMTIRTRNLPTLPGNQFYYAWLLDPETDKMLPLGQIGPDGRATFELPVSLLGQYSAIDISLEADDGDPGHSVTSVLRASYDPDAATTDS